MPYSFSLLWWPRCHLVQLAGIRVAWLVALFIGAEFIAALPVLGVISDAVRRGAAANPAVTPDAIPYVIAFAVGFAATINVVIAGVVAVPLRLVTLIAGARSSYRAIAGMLVLASLPLLVGHALRNLSYGLGWKRDATSSVLALDQVLPPIHTLVWQRLLHGFDVFDVSTLLLVLVGFTLVSGMKRWPALATAMVIWGMLQTLLFRLSEAGGAP
jgi:hypothetical protein